MDSFKKSNQYGYGYSIQLGNLIEPQCISEICNYVLCFYQEQTQPHFLKMFLFSLSIQISPYRLHTHTVNFWSSPGPILVTHVQWLQVRFYEAWQVAAVFRPFSCRFLDNSCWWVVKLMELKEMFIIKAKWQTAEIRTERLNTAENHWFTEPKSRGIFQHSSCPPNPPWFIKFWDIDKQYRFEMVVNLYSSLGYR